MGGWVDMKERMPDSDFMCRASSTLLPLMNHYVKITVRTGFKKELRTY